MRRTLSRTRSEAPFLFSERGSLSLTRALTNVGGGGTALGDGDQHTSLTLRGEHALRGALSDCDGDGATLNGGGGLTLTRCSMREANLTGDVGGRWDVVDATGATVTGSAPGGSFSLVSFRDGALTDGDFTGATFVLCDFSGVALSGLNLSGCRFVGCDFSDAWLADVDVSGADLRGCTFRGAGIASSLAGADVTGADFRGASGLDEAALTALKGAGARTGAALLVGLWSKVLMKEPSLQAHRRVRKAVSGTWAAFAIALPVIFFARAAMSPAEPDYGPDMRQSYEAPEEPEAE
ncbi:MAG: pentapeptide repeat-containing protein [Proteobacteria bacterium]|nr:pentapeptide repeat-containing protein [Pseudomonadota bacterium]